jgi:hypothetical protein
VRKAHSSYAATLAATLWKVELTTSAWMGPVLQTIAGAGCRAIQVDIPAFDQMILDLMAGEPMKRLKLWSLVAALTLGNLLGCSRASTNSPDAADRIRKSFDQSGRDHGEGREETGPETTKGKPSACIKWAKGSGRTSKTLRKAVKTAADPEAIPEDREKKLQAENEQHTQ